MALLETRNLLAQRGFSFEQSLPAPFFAIECVESLQLDVQREKRLDGFAQRIQLRARGLNSLELTCNSLGVAVESGFLLFRNCDLSQ